MYERIIEGIARYDLACVIVVTIPMPVIIIAVPCGGTAEFELIPDKCDIIQIRHSPVDGIKKAGRRTLETGWTADPVESIDD